MNDLQKTDRLLSESLEEGWQLFSQNLALYVLAGLIHALLSVVTLGILTPPLTVGLIEMVQRSRSGQSVQAGDIFSGFSSFGASFVAGLIMALLVGLGFLLFFLPGFVLLAGWLFTFQAIALDRMGAMAAMAHSWDLFKENLPLTLVLCVLLLVANSIGSAVLLGTILTFPYSVICVTIAYEKLTNRQALPDQELKPFGVE